MIDQEKLKELREAQAKLTKLHKLEIKAKSRVIGLQSEGKSENDEKQKSAFESWNYYSNAESEQRHVVYVLEKELFGTPKKPKKTKEENK